MKLSQTIEYYLDFSYTLTERTCMIYRDHLSRLCGYLDDPSLTDISPICLARFMKSLKRRDGLPYSSSYIDQTYRSLHAFFEFCVEHELLPASPMDRLAHPPVETGSKPRLSLQQVGDLLHQVQQTICADRNLSIILLMVDSGLRLNEVVSLRATDVMLDEKMVRVYAAKTRKWHDVPIRADTVQAIQRYLKKRPPFTSHSESLFLTRDKRPLTKRAVHLLMKRLQQRLGFPLHAHLLRHTFAHIYNRKGNLAKLQRIMGHSRIDTTARFYAAPSIEDIKSEHETVSPIAQLMDLVHE